MATENCRYIVCAAALSTDRHHLPQEDLDFVEGNNVTALDVLVG
eukprot:UN06149